MGVGGLIVGDGVLNAGFTVGMFVRGVGVGDDLTGSIRVSQTRVRIRCIVLAFAKPVDECIVLTNEQVVIEAEANTPVVRESGYFLAMPLRLDDTIRRRDVAALKDR